MICRASATYLSVCSGICAPTVAWKPLGMSPVGFAEIEKFPSAVLAHHYPDVPNLGDITADDFIERAAALKPDGLVGGTPCQAFSVAGSRQSLDDDRGNLTLRFTELLHGCGCRWAVWENVPGVLSTKDNAFGCFLAGVIGAEKALVPSDGKRRWNRAGAAYGPKAAAAWRVLDAQYFGLAQRRKRVFVVIRVGATGFDPAKVLFECEGVRRDTPPSREAGQGTTPILEAGARTGRSTTDARCGIGVGDEGDPMFTLQAGKQHGVHQWPAEVAPTIDCSFADKYGQDNQHIDGGAGMFVMAHGQAGAEIVSDGDPSLTCNHEAPIVFDTTQVTSPHNRSNPKPGDPSHPLAAGAHPPTVAFSCKDYGADAGEVSPTLRAMGHGESHANSGGQVAVAYQCHGGNVGPMGTLRTGSNEAGGVPFVAYRTCQSRMSSYADASETNAVKALRVLQEEAGAQAFSEWCLGILAPLWPQEVLREEVYGVGFRREAFSLNGLVYLSLSRQEESGGWPVRTLWQAGCVGCPPSGWGRDKQSAEQLATHMSKLPYSPSPAKRFMQIVWEASEGIGVLREALSTIQEARRPARGKGESTHSCQVRRLTVEECEALQGLPRSFTLIPFTHGKPAADGPRYKALGNSMATTVLQWLGMRLAMFGVVAPSASKTVGSGG